MSGKNLYGVPFTVILTDGTALDGQVVMLAEDEAMAKAGTQSWLSNARPWVAGGNDTRQIERSDVAEPEELETFYACGIGTKPLFWEMHRRNANLSEDPLGHRDSRERGAAS
jgi:hypothetical protein